MLPELAAAEIFGYFIVFCRLGATVMMMPLIGERFVPNRARLGFALLFALIVYPVVARQIPAMPPTIGGTVLLIAGELGVGMFIGMISRLLVNALETAGTIISYQTGLSSALFFNPLAAEQGSLIGVLLTLVGTLLLFQTNLHHVMIRGLVDSYGVFVPGRLPPIGDFTQAITKMVSESFAIAMRLSGPLLLVITVLFIALGVLSRLMPQLQVFFVGLPLQIALGFLIVAVTLSTAMLIFLDRVGAGFGALLSPP